MILKEFKTGWQKEFEHKIQSLFNVLPNITLKSIERYRGMLRINIQALDKDTQYIVDCTTYVIERESAKTCEHCGNHGIRRHHEEWLPEMTCLCLPCYTMAIDNTISQQSK